MNDEQNCEADGYELRVEAAPVWQKPREVKDAELDDSSAGISKLLVVDSADSVFIKEDIDVLELLELMADGDCVLLPGIKKLDTEVEDSAIGIVALSVVGSAESVCVIEDDRAYSKLLDSKADAEAVFIGPEILLCKVLEEATLRLSEKLVEEDDRSCARTSEEYGSRVVDVSVQPRSSLGDGEEGVGNGSGMLELEIVAEEDGAAETEFVSILREV